MARTPDFVILGAQKCGTTSLHALLSTHPQVVTAPEKEVHFFDRHWERGEAWYRSQFPGRDEHPGTIAGEATPHYLFHEPTPERMARVAPDARFVVLLRDPVERAYSHHQMQVRRGMEHVRCEAALRLEAQRLAMGGGAVARYSYQARGRYAEQLERWFACFPRDRFLVLESGGVFRATRATLATLGRLTGFLGIDPFPEDTVLARRASGGSYRPMSPRTRRELVEAFTPHNERLFRLLGVRWPWPSARSPIQAPPTRPGRG